MDIDLKKEKNVIFTADYKMDLIKDVTFEYLKLRSLSETLFYSQKSREFGKSKKVAEKFDEIFLKLNTLFLIFYSKNSESLHFYIGDHNEKIGFSLGENFINDEEYTIEYRICKLANDKNKSLEIILSVKTKDIIEESINICKLTHVVESIYPDKYLNDLILRTGNKNLESDLKNMIGYIEETERNSK